MKTDFSRIGDATLARIEKGILPGATICVYREGRLVYEFTGGYSDLESKTPLRSDAIFRLCSMTKPITAAAVLWAQDRGLLKVGDRVADYLPEFADRNVLRIEGDKRILEKSARDFTIEDILTHSSGLGSVVGMEYYDYKLRGTATTLAEMIPSYVEMPLDFTPGSAQYYSALVALDLAARIVEIVTDTEYETFLRENIFLPLGMKNTAYKLTPAQQARLVTLYRLTDAADGLERKDVPTGHEGFAAGCVSGCAALFGTRDDYARFAEMLCREGELDGVRILSKQAVRSMRTPHSHPLDEYSRWGYAVRVRERIVPDAQELSIGSFGWSGAYNTHFWVDPALNLTCVYMSNMDNSGGWCAVTASECERNVMRSLAAYDR